MRRRDKEIGDREELRAILARPSRPVFDRDTYSLLVSALFGRKQLKVLPLQYESGPVAC